MKLLLLAFNVQENVFPLGLSYIDGFLKKYHPDVQTKIKEFSFGKRFSYDINRDIELQVMSYILLQNPDVVGFSCYLWSVEIIKKIAKTIKQIKPNIKIILGGVEVNENSLTNDVDFIIKGEGEETFKELFDYFKGQRKIEDVHNIVYKNKNDKIILNSTKLIENLDDIPFPYRRDKEKDYDVVRIETTRGCPFNCKYCHYAQAKRIRNFSVEYLREHLVYLFNNYKFNNLTILDANFNVNKKRMSEILDIIEDNVQKHEIKLSVSFELKPELIDKEMINILSKYSFDIKVELGLQSTDKEVLLECDRNFDLDKIKNGLKLLDENHINYKIDLMYGLPKDNFYKFINSARFILNNSKRQYQLPAHHFMLLNNTSFYDNYDRELVRFDKVNSSMIVKTENQNLLDIYKTKLFVKMINEELKLYRLYK